MSQTGAMNGRTLIFCDEEFPVLSALPEAGIWGEHGVGHVRVVGAEELTEALDGMSAGDCFVNLHAPYFPKPAWTAILAYLKRGGSLLSGGGAPFKRPVRRQEQQWVVEAEQTAYHQELYIHEALKVTAAKVTSLSAYEAIPLFIGLEELLEPADTWNLVPHTTKSSDLPHQMGSAGPMSTQIHPLLTGVSADGRHIAAPVVLWENSRGPFGGSRWMFVNQPLTAAFWEKGGAAELLKWAEFCANGVTEMSLKSNYATYELGERPVLTLQTQILQQGKKHRKQPEPWTFELHIEREAQSRQGSAEVIWEHKLCADVTGEQRFERIALPFPVHNGLYRVICRAQGPSGETRVLRQGFWGRDAALLSEGEILTRGRDYFMRGDRAMPVVGMTYMASDVARKFLFLPNPDVWDRDMAQMARAGINWIRTGVWTAYRNMMQVDGHVSEEVLRAIDAFLLTAKRHGLQVTFTFFSFTPETWEGVNPYLDPQSVEAQKRFIRSIVSRHRHTTNVDWDLINEPSMFDPARIFSKGPRSARDAFEQEAFVAWLEKRHGTVEALQEAWNMSPQQLPDFSAAVIPEPEEINFDVQDMHQAKKGTRWLDYCLFSMDMHNVWVKQLVEAIKDLCPQQLVTVGQDEALGAQRPSPFFYQQEVDYTTVHSWWLNDDLVWDSIFAKTPDKPCLVQETGIMYVETPDGRAKRTEEELYCLLERKYAYAFATGGAGAVQWIWNTNFYMDNANESHIGALRADGTEKPEAAVSYDFGRFMRQIAHLFTDRSLEDIVVVFPYSNDFSNRALAYEATTRLTRVMAYELKLPFRAASEYHLNSLQSRPPKLIIVPSPHNLDSGALQQLLQLVQDTGSHLLVTGPLGLDAYWRKTDRADSILGERRLGNVQREEVLDIQGTYHRLTYGRRRIAEVAKEEQMQEQKGSQPAEVVHMPFGKGSILWSPLPVELNGRDEPLAALYRCATELAGISSELEWLAGGDCAGVYGRKLAFAGGNLFIFVSEYAVSVQVHVRDAVTSLSYEFLLEKNRSVLFATDAGGQLLAVYRPEEVEITLHGREVE
ncbi:beta-galactosidase [Paenibacillus terreus]|uniref:Beta-galactosidase n=1 Tax=Paenibacillus terreus TaxID=1387834 RepID=A0ABV5BEF1_9BACL